MPRINRFTRNTVGQLRQLIENLPDQTPVLVPGGDHGYYSASGVRTTVLTDKYGEYSEDHGESLTPIPVGGQRLVALVIGSN